MSAFKRNGHSLTHRLQTSAGPGSHGLFTVWLVGGKIMVVTLRFPPLQILSQLFLPTSLASVCKGSVGTLHT